MDHDESDVRTRFREGQPIGDGRGTLTVDGESYALSEAGLELYHCDSREADWNLFAFSDRKHGANDDSVGVALHGTVSPAPTTVDDLVGLELQVESDNAGWEADFVVNGQQGDLYPGFDCILRVASGGERNVRLELRDALFSFLATEDGRERDVAVSLEVEVSVVSMRRG